MKSYCSLPVLPLTTCYLCAAVEKPKDMVIGLRSWERWLRAPTDNASSLDAPRPLNTLHILVAFVDDPTQITKSKCTYVACHCK